MSDIKEKMFRLINGVDFDPSQNTHVSVYVLRDEIIVASKLVQKGFLKKELHRVEYTDVIELINDGIKEYGDRYIGTFDAYYFDKPNPKTLISKCSYDELVTVHIWRYELSNVKPIFGTKYLEEDISKDPLLHKIKSQRFTELQTMYNSTKNPDDPEYESQKNTKFQFGPPSEIIGPNNKPFGDFKERLVYDNILNTLHDMYYSFVNRNEKEFKRHRVYLISIIKHNEAFTKLPNFGMNELYEIIDVMGKRVGF